MKKSSEGGKKSKERGEEKSAFSATLRSPIKSSRDSFHSSPRHPDGRRRLLIHCTIAIVIPPSIPLYFNHHNLLYVPLEWKGSWLEIQVILGSHTSCFESLDYLPRH